MENRRQHYRHEFAPTRVFVVRLQSVDGDSTLQGELLNLSIGGMCVYAPALKEKPAQKWIATLPLGAENETVSIPAKRVYVRNADTACYGFRFLEDADVEAAEAREKAVWSFLLNEQRRRRRFLQGA